MIKNYDAKNLSSSSFSLQIVFFPVKKTSLLLELNSVYITDVPLNYSLRSIFGQYADKIMFKKGILKYLYLCMLICTDKYAQMSFVIFNLTIMKKNALNN